MKRVPKRRQSVRNVFAIHLDGVISRDLVLLPPELPMQLAGAMGLALHRLRAVLYEERPCKRTLSSQRNNV